MGYNAPKQTVSQFQLKGRYARQYLSFAGKSSKDFLLYLRKKPGSSGAFSMKSWKGKPIRRLQGN